MSLGATFANGAWWLSSLGAARQFSRGLESPAEAQARLLAASLDANQYTEYGRKYHFGRIQTYEEFARHVPVVDYEELQPWIARIRQGEPSILTRDPVTRLVPTSGSTGARKLIPITAGLLDQFNAGIGPWMVGLFRDQPSLAGGAAYWSVSTGGAFTDSDASRIPIGFDDDSRYLGGSRRRLIEPTMAVPAALRLIDDLRVFRTCVLNFLLRRRDLRLISVGHPSFLTLLLDHLPGCWAELLNEIASGGCRWSDSVAPQVRAALRFPPDRRRAAELEQLGPSNLAGIWPSLRLVSCWGDAHASGALAALQARLPQVRFQPKGLLSTEAVVTVPFAGQHPVAVCSHFYEFIDAAGAVHPVEDLQADRIYEVVVTTAGGLWRYRSGDQVKVTGVVERTPSLSFMGRRGNVSDRFGEKLSEAFVTLTLRAAWPSLEAVPAFAMLAPEKGSDGSWCYTLYVEGEVADGLAGQLDAALSENVQYANCRRLGQLIALRVVRLKPARGYETFVAVQMANGARLGDIKPVSLSQRADWTQAFRHCIHDPGAKE